MLFSEGLCLVVSVSKMPSCSAIGCTNRSSDENCTVSFHRLLVKKKDIWLAKIKREGGEKLTD